MQALSTLAAAQHGLVSRSQAHALGLTDAMLRSRVRRGMLTRVDARVFRVAGAPPSWHQRVMAACLAGGPECLASHRTAATLHGLDGFSAASVEVLVPHGRRYRREGVVVHSTRDLSPEDRCLVGTIPTTSVARTLVDLGAVTHFERVEIATDGAERDRLIGRDVLTERHAQLRKQGRNGIAIMNAVLLDRPRRSPHSPLERRFVTMIERGGLPVPDCQHVVLLPNGRRAILDCAYPELRLGIELDGHGAHATRRQRAADNERANALHDLGWDLRRFTYEQVTRDGMSVVAAMRRALAPLLASGAIR